MKFYGRASIFFVLFGLILIFLGYTVTSFTSSFSEKNKSYSGKRKECREGVYVFTDQIKKTEEIPVIYSYGEVKSWRTLEIRTPVVGKISEVAEIFRDGSPVVKGDFLFSIDDKEYQDNLNIAETDLRDAESDLINAKTLFKLSQMDLQAAEKRKRSGYLHLKGRRNLKKMG